MAHKSDSVHMNPLVMELLERKGKPIELAGYVGPPSENGWLRLYRDMSLATYAEIPEDAVIRIRESDDPEGITRIFFDGSIEIRYVTTTMVRLQDPARRGGGCVGCGSQVMRRRRRPGGGGGGPDCAAGSKTPEIYVKIWPTCVGVKRTKRPTLLGVRLYTTSASGAAPRARAR